MYFRPRGKKSSQIFMPVQPMMLVDTSVSDSSVDTIAKKTSKPMRIDWTRKTMSFPKSKWG